VAISESPASTPTDLFSRIQSLGFEQVQFCHDRTTGLRAIIAIHDTTLGPALGGIRMRPYASEEEALTDVLRLARA
jgi:glutamate dehydrogenase/leucine dehydrogenase